MNTPSPDKPYGHRLTIELNGSSEPILKHWVGSEATCRRKAMMVTRARRVTDVEPFTREQWLRSFGDPSIRTRFI